MKRVKIREMHIGGLYIFDIISNSRSDGTVRVFSDAPINGVNPYIEAPKVLRVRTGRGKNIPWILLDVRKISFLIAPAQGRTSVKSRTTHMTLHHIATPSGVGWVDMEMSSDIIGNTVKELSLQQAA